MKFKRRLKNQQFFNQGNNISFLNIIFLLLAFLALSGSLSIMPGINIDFPVVLSSDEFGRNILTVTLSGKNLLYINKKQVAYDDFESILIKKKYDSVFIKADKKANLEMLSDIWSICKKAGVEKISIATTYN